MAVPATVIYFTCYDQLCAALRTRMGSHSEEAPLLAGAIARGERGPPVRGPPGARAPGARAPWSEGPRSEGPRSEGPLERGPPVRGPPGR